MASWNLRVILLSLLFLQIDECFCLALFHYQYKIRNLSMLYQAGLIRMRTKLFFSHISIVLGFHTHNVQQYGTHYVLSRPCSTGRYGTSPYQERPAERGQTIIRFITKPTVSLTIGKGTAFNPFDKKYKNDYNNCFQQPPYPSGIISSWCHKGYMPAPSWPWYNQIWIRFQESV